MIKTTTEVIGDNTYIITTFDAITGNLILFKIIKYLRGGASLLNGLLEGKNIMEEDIAVGDMLEKIMTNIEPEELNEFMIKLLKSTTVNNKPMTAEIIKHHFAGNYFEMYKVIAAIIKVNYMTDGVKSFFEQAQSQLKKGKIKK